MILLLIVGLIKKTLYKNKLILSKPFRNFGGNVNVKVHFSNCATKANIKFISDVNTSSFALKSNLGKPKLII